MNLLCNDKPEKNMNDKDLLIAAATAVGMEIGFRKSGLVVIQGVASIGPSWNPLESNRDALSLAVTLGICIEFGYCSDDAPIVECGRLEDRADWVMTPNFPDPEAATRRAIVRAAAAIGSSHNVRGNRTATLAAKPQPAVAGPCSPTC
jgi:hypothetical protein